VITDEAMKEKMVSINKNSWKPIDASLPDPASNFNHYDNVKSSRDANQDLEGQPAESFGMFFGLEVLDGSLYEVRNNRMIIKSSETKSKSNGNQNDEASSASAKEPSESASTKKRECSKISSTDDQKILNDASERKSIEKSTSSRSKKKKKQSFDDKRNQEVTNNSQNVQEILALQSTWTASTNGVNLHETLCKALLQQGFGTPTPIQAATLPATILGRRNIVGAAATGSGKTLAYVLPILQFLLESNTTLEKRILQALILAPTRELALQVAYECEKLMPKSTGVIVGGLAVQKQVRILDKRKPPIIIGTPGRLWEMMATREHDHLNGLSELRFLVIDEADRMVQQGSFPQLKRILNAVHEANPLDDREDEDEDDDESVGSDDDPDRLLSLPGVPGEARVLMLDDILNQSGSENGQSNLRSQNEVCNLEGLTEDDKRPCLSPRINRQTFVFSATLTLAPSDTYVKKNSRKIKADTPGGGIGEILEVAHVHGKTKVVDLTSSGKLASANNSFSVSKVDDAEAKSRLPPGLKLHVIECTQKHKDSHLYTYITTTTQGASGTCLIFCNSIATVKRLGATLQKLSLPVKMLHANMPQKARLKALDTLRAGHDRAIVVSTDVAARGLDIPKIATIVHYDVARVVGTFIHRAGRTAVSSFNLFMVWNLDGEDDINIVSD